MAKLFEGGEAGGTHCAVPTCRQPNPKLYDERTELYFCDRGCFTEYVAKNPEDFAEWYAGLNLHELD